MKCVSTILILFTLFFFRPIYTAQSKDIGRQLATNTVFVALDTETTGLSPTRDRIVEIALVKFQNGKITATNSWLINPGMPIPAPAERVHGISDEMVADKPSCAETLPKVNKFVGDAVLLAHNARFDIGFLKNEYKRSKTAPPGNICLDTLKLAGKWFPESKSHSLKNLITHLNIEPHKKFHRALADSLYLVYVMDQGIAGMGSDIKMADIIKLHGAPLAISKGQKRKNDRK